jgi:iduronate 2-sulfatase
MHPVIIRFSIASVLFFLTGGCDNNAGGQESLRPNVLFICVDDLRPELGCYGVKEIHTPNIDRLAGQGVLFSRNYCQVAVCAPSRASLWTGMRPDSLRVWHLGDRFRDLNPNVVTIPQYFEKYGYHTVSMGKIFHNHMPDSVSFMEPDLRPDDYLTAGMIDRDPESFYVDEALREELAGVREQRLQENPGAYADGWAYGRATECTQAPDTAFYDGAQTLLAIQTLKRLRTLDKPFFLALGYFRPHLPFSAPKRYWDLYDRDSISPASNPFLPENSPVMAMNSAYELTGCYDLEYVRHPFIFQLSEDTARLLKHGYYASVSYVDACIGKLMGALDDMGLAENTIVVLWGDHGWKLGEHGSWCKQTNYSIDTRVPLIIRLPGEKQGSTICRRLTESIDIYPTLCELAGLRVPDWLGGTSMWPVMEHPDRPWKTAAFSQFHRRPRVSPDGNRYMGYSMVTENYHLVEWHAWDPAGSMSPDVVACELYDLQTDPQENVNVAGDTRYEERLEELSARLEHEWPANRKIIHVTE